MTLLDVGRLSWIDDGGRILLLLKLLMVRDVGRRRRSLLFGRKVRHTREKRRSHIEVKGREKDRSVRWKEEEGGRAGCRRAKKVEFDEQGRKGGTRS